MTMRDVIHKTGST